MAQEPKIPQINVNVDVKGLANAIGLQNDLRILIPHNYVGDPKEFRNWVKQIEKYSFMNETPEDKVKMVAYKTSAGPVSDFIERYITTYPDNTWAELKRELMTRFAEIAVPEQALRMLRNMKQMKDENVQCYAERVLSVATDALMVNPDGMQAYELQVIGYFSEGLYYDYMQFKLLREKPKNLQAAIRTCIEEQNLRKLFKNKTGRDYGLKRDDNGFRTEEPMDVDQIWPTRTCHICKRKGHTAAFCRREQSQPVNVVENKPRCYFCGKFGHIKRFCHEYARANSTQTRGTLNEIPPRV